MRKLFLILCAGVVLTLAACGGKDAAQKTEKTTEVVTTAAPTEKESETEAEESTTKKPETKIVKGSAEGFGGTITVTLTMEGDDIVDASVVGNDETPDVGGKALNELSEQLIDKDGYEIDGVSGATYTSEGVRNAAKDALGLYLDEKKEQ